MDNSTETNYEVVMLNRAYNPCDYFGGGLPKKGIFIKLKMPFQSKLSFDNCPIQIHVYQYNTKRFLGRHRDVAVFFP